MGRTTTLENIFIEKGKAKLEDLEAEFNSEEVESDKIKKFIFEGRIIGYSQGRSFFAYQTKSLYQERMSIKQSGPDKQYTVGTELGVTFSFRIREKAEIFQYYIRPYEYQGKMRQEKVLRVPIDLTPTAEICIITWEDN